MAAEGERPHYHEHRQRLRSRFAAAGAEALQDYELLELLLGFAIPRRDVKPIGKALIGRFGSLAGVLDASLEELQEVDGVGEYSAVLIRLTRELGSAYLGERVAQKIRLDSAVDVADFARARLVGRAHETFMVIFLDTQNRVLAHQLLGEGTVDRVVVYPRRILAEALRHQAAGLILAHNHPSGAVEPSADDLALTRELKETARSLDILVLDHLIVGREGYHSLAEAGEM